MGSAAVALGHPENSVAEITRLLHEFDSPAKTTTADGTTRIVNAGGARRTQLNRLIEARLGVASGLFAALQGKHEPTADHCLRVALGCSAWAEKIGLPESQRDEIELAALLHDVGKIGVPESVLAKPSRLTTQEMAVVDQHWKLGEHILRSCCSRNEVIDIVRYARSWYDGSRHRLDEAGDAMPLGARMLAIVDAFDAMMSDHVYRRALSTERAYHELYQFAGTQFDPALVMLFIKLHDFDGLRLHESAVERWLQQLSPEAINAPWQRNELAPRGPAKESVSLFHQKLLDNMYDGVVFVDAGMRICLWNRGAERLTGISSASVYQRLWLPSLLDVRDERERTIRDEDCPVAHAVQTGVQWLRRLTIRGRNGRDLAVDAHAAPVVDADGHTRGVTLLLHDVSPEISLEARCQNLHELATKDPLTQVANRAEFDRVLSKFVEAHRETKRPCSLIMSDIDRFKLINDNYGHPAGDAIIQSFARLLQSSCRPGDLVARYGGEEFAVLCADCDNSSAAKRADEIRTLFARMQQTAIDGRCASASFGVTEIQPGDTPETMLARSDRALLMAKETGRNRVIQLGIGTVGDDSSAALPSRQATATDLLLSQELVTQSPGERTLDKLRGFISDHHAEVLTVEENEVTIRVGKSSSLFSRREGDREIALLMWLRVTEEKSETTEERRTGLARTRIALEIRPVKSRDRRKQDAIDRAKQLLTSLRSYLMATEVSARVQAEPADDSGLWGALTGWLR
jgi:diguanylate cyclase (GGDEF)-like protein/putative nucleotidyltransferase with HDIG domain/PAS domain S-box-containing protein